MYIDVNISQMDLTGTDPLYKRINVPFRVYKSNQMISFEEPVYQDSITVFRAVGGAAVNFTTGPLDDTATARAKYVQSVKQPNVTFNKPLVNNIIIPTAIGNEFTIHVTYQALHKDTVVLTGDDIGPTYTPGLMRTVLNKVAYLENLIPSIPSISEEAINPIQVLAEDLTAANPDNFIQDEIHMQVNTLANRFVIRPANGSFYKQDLVVKFNDKPLVENVDYEITGLNHGKTRVSSSTGGVYDYIILIKPISAGVVTLTYRAFGGVVCPAAMNQVQLILTDLIHFIKLGGLLTSDGLQAHPIIVTIIDRIINIENMLKIAAPITYSYAATQAEKWCDIADIAADNISGVVPQVGTGQLRVRCGKYFSEIKLNYDVASARSLDAQLLSSWNLSVDEDEVGYFNNRICPKFRVIWNNNAISSGLVLQMSVTTKTSKTVYVEIQNSAGLFSNMTLKSTDGNILPDRSAATTLPDGTTWNSSSGAARASNTIVASGKSYTIFTGTVPTSITDSYSYTNFELDDPQDNTVPIQTKQAGLMVPIDVTGVDIVMSEITAIRFKIYDRYTGTMISKTSEYVDVDEDVVRASAMYFTSDLCCAECELAKRGSSYTLAIGSSTGTNSLINNRFDFKQVDVIFKGAGEL